MTRNKLVILDIDETLLHATSARLDREPDLESQGICIYKRPYLDEFLAFCGNHFPVAVWTTAGGGYAEFVVERLFPRELSLAFIHSKDHCTLVPVTADNPLGMIKDLGLVAREQFPLESLIMIDDSPEKLVRTPRNLVRVRGYYGDPADRELERLMAFLALLKYSDEGDGGKAFDAKDVAASWTRFRAG